MKWGCIKWLTIVSESKVDGGWQVPSLEMRRSSPSVETKQCTAVDRVRSKKYLSHLNYSRVQQGKMTDFANGVWVVCREQYLDTIKAFSLKGRVSDGKVQQ